MYLKKIFIFKSSLYVNSLIESRKKLFIRIYFKRSIPKGFQGIVGCNYVIINNQKKIFVKKVKFVVDEEYPE